MAFLHMVATWAVAVGGTLAIILGTLWLFEKVVNAFVRWFNIMPMVKEFAVWYMANNRKPCTMKAPVDVPDPRRSMD